TLQLPSYGAAGDVAQLETARLVFTIGASSLAGIFVASHAERLQRYLLAGLAGAMAGAVAFGAVLLVDPERHVEDVWWAGGAILGGGVLMAVLAGGGLLVLGRPFGVPTRAQLIEPAHVDHPLLRRP